MLSPPPRGAPTVAFSYPVSPTPRLNSVVTSCASLSPPSPSAVGPHRRHLWPLEQTLPCVATASTPHCRQLSPVSSRRLGVVRRPPRTPLMFSPTGLEHLVTGAAGRRHAATSALCAVTAPRAPCRFRGRGWAGQAARPVKPLSYGPDSAQ
jgi:hypothetical protein